MMFCHWIILYSLINYIESIQMIFEVKDTTDTEKSASYFTLKSTTEED
jgi:hypothetical protein